ncbi:MAG: PepSY-associated TM helix domain-containing protein, partial [Planctomycetota bacterium]
MTDKAKKAPRKGFRRKLYTKSAAFFRWFHIYVSMVCFGTMIFFSLTGITLNHPTWFGASDFQIEDKSGQLPTELLA